MTYMLIKHYFKSSESETELDLEVTHSQANTLSVT